MQIENDPDSDPDPDSRKQDLRPSPIAGLWYSGNPKHLTLEIDEYINKPDLPLIDGEIIGLIAPHAGYRYSGKTAGYAYKTILNQEYDLVAILSPFHAYHPDTILSSAHRAYNTPLGNVEVDHTALEKLSQYLLQETGRGITYLRNDSEHSLEIEIPFLQRSVKGDFKILPLMLRERDASILKKLGKGLARILVNQKSLLVASTDLSHFYSQETACNLDQTILDQINSFSPEEILRSEEEGTGFACGAPAVAAVLWAAREIGAKNTLVLHHSTSAEETGDNSSVVGYGAAVIYK